MGRSLSVLGEITFDPPISALRVGYVPDQIGNILIRRNTAGDVVALAPDDSEVYKGDRRDEMDTMVEVAETLPQVSGIGYIQMDMEGPGPNLRCALIEGQMRVSYGQWNDPDNWPDPAQGPVWGSPEQEQADKDAPLLKHWE